MPIRRILHLDMDAFYASVEQRDDAALRGRPVAVGGGPNGRGVVCAASYEARVFGVRSAMPSSRAARLCPDLVFVSPDFAKYKAVSDLLRAMFHDTTDHVEPLSLDEAFLDVTENHLGMATGTEVAKHLRQRVRDELHLTCSVGVAPLKFVAKIASDYRKPDGLTVVPPDRVLEFIHPLKISKLWGVGPATERRLNALGIYKVADLAALDEGSVRARLGSHGTSLWRMSQGEDPRRVRARTTRRSRSAERTFAEDISDLHELDRVISEQATRVGSGLEGAGLTGKTVVVKVRYDDFTTVSRTATLAQATNDPDLIAQEARSLLRRTEAGSRPVRLIGVGVAGLGDPAPSAQLPLPLKIGSRLKEA